MTQNDIISEPVLTSAFNFADFRKEAIARLKAGQSLTGNGGVLTPLIKEIVNASLECEMEEHLEVCSQNG